MAVVSGHFSVGRLSGFLSYANQYTKPFNEISGVITELQNALACAARIFELIEEEPQVPDAPDALVLTEPDGTAELSHVSFSYTPEKKLIEDPTRFVNGIEKAPLFQKATADLNPRKLTYFLENQGGRHIAGAMLEKAREIQQKTEENLKKAALQAAQKKAALQAAQKSIKEDVPVTRPRSKTQPAGPKPKL